MFGSDHASREIKRNREEGMVRAQKRRDKTNSYYSIQNKTLNFKEVPEEELETIKMNIREKGKQRRNRILILTLIGSTIIAIGIYYILSNIIT